MKRTSLVFDCWEQLFDALTHMAWPVHPTTGELPSIALSAPTNPLDEMVVVPGRSQDDSARQEWVTMGRPSKEERFTLDVHVWTNVPGRSAIEAKDRIKQLVSIVEIALRDPVTGLPLGIQLGPSDGLQQWGVSEIVPAVGPLPDAEGFGANCRIGVDFWTRL